MSGGFVKDTGEKADLNQFWFSTRTIDAFVKEIQAVTKKGAAFLSTPSLYYSLTDPEIRQKSKLFEYDRQWEDDSGFEFYDYNNPEAVNISNFGAFDVVVIDPPFITEECWEAYAKTTRLLLCEGGKVIATTIAENEGIMARLLGCTPVKYQPSIPNLVYQYNTYTSYHPTTYLEEPNEEIAAENHPGKEIQRALMESREQFIAMAQNRDRTGEEVIPQRCVGKAKWDRVPEGLSEYAAGGPPPEEVKKTPEDYGEEYAKLAHQREKVGEASKLINDACRPLDQMWKNAVLVKKAVQEKDAAKQEKAEEALLKAKENLAKHLSDLRAVLEEFPTREEGSVGKIISDALEHLTLDSITKEEYGKLAPDVLQRYKSPLFNHQKAMLAEMKALKKNSSA